MPFGVVCTCFGILNYFHLANFETFMIWHRTLPGSQHEGAQQQRMRSSRSWRPGAALLSTPTSCRRASRRSSLPCLLEMCILHVQCQLPLMNFKIGVLPASFDANLRGWTRENQIVTEDNLDSLQQRCAPSPAIRSWPDEQPTDDSGGYAEVAQSCQVS